MGTKKRPQTPSPHALLASHSERLPCKTIKSFHSASCCLNHYSRDIHVPRGSHFMLEIHTHLLNALESWKADRPVFAF